MFHYMYRDLVFIHYWRHASRKFHLISPLQVSEGGVVCRSACGISSFHIAELRAFVIYQCTPHGLQLSGIAEPPSTASVRENCFWVRCLVWPILFESWGLENSGATPSVKQTSAATHRPRPGRLTDFARASAEQPE